MSGSKYSPAAIREVWQKEGKQRWDGRTHGRGHCLLIVDVLAPGRLGSPNPSFEFWRDQNKIRGRFIGEVVGNGIMVAKLNEEGRYPNKKPADQRADVRYGRPSGWHFSPRRRFSAAVLPDRTYGRASPK
jgi:hypothetical protein